MNKLKLLYMLIVFVTASAICPLTSYSQRLYDKQRDEQAQKALELAEPLKSGSIFEKQLKNLANRTKLDFETEFLVRKFEINSESLNTIKWSSAHEIVCTIQSKNANIPQIPTKAQVEKAVKEVKEAVVKTKNSLKEFECQIKEGTFDSKTGECAEPKESDPTLTSLFDRLGDLRNVMEFSEKLNEELPGDEIFNPKTLEALGKIKDTIEQLEGVYKDYKTKVEEYNKLAAELDEMKLTLKKIVLQSLQVDEAHLKNVAAIRARLETEQGDIFSLISRYKGYVSRLELTPPFKLKAPNQSSDDFCRVKDDDKFAFKNELMIVEHLKEMVQHSKRLEQDNQNILSKAKIALLKLNKTTTNSAEISQAIRDTVSNIDNAKKNIDNNETIHLREKELSCVDKTRDGFLDACLATISQRLQSASTNEQRRQVLQNIIALSYENTVVNRDMTADIPQALYDLAALISRGNTPLRLAELRLATEYHAYSIRKSAVRARAYELTVSTGAKRLSLFHKGGIKPETIAELVFAISNTAIPPSILAK